MTDSILVDLTRVHGAPTPMPKLEAAIIMGAVGAWERRHNTGILEFSIYERGDMGAGIVELRITKTGTREDAALARAEAEKPIFVHKAPGYLQ